MKKSQCMLFGIIVVLLIALAGCSNKGQVGTQVEDAAAGTEEVADTSASDIAEDLTSGRNLLKKNDIMLAFEEPENEWKILLVKENIEKTEYLAVVKITDDRYKNESTNSWTELHFFNANGSFLRKITSKLVAWSDMSKSNIRYSNNTLRIKGEWGDVIYVDTTSGEIIVTGKLVCSDDAGELVADEASNMYYLVQDSKITSSVEMKIDDLNYIYNDIDKVKYHLDSKSKIATYETKHIRYMLDFNTKKFTLERFYAEDDFKNLLGTSEDGTLEVYTACEGGAGDASWSQIVTRDKQTGKVSFLAYSDNDCILGADDMLIVYTLSSLELYNIKTGEKVDNFFAFPFKADSGKENALLGLYYDKEKEQYLFAYRDEIEYSISPEKAPIFVMKLDKEGKVIKKMDIALKITPINKDGFIVNVYIKANDDGSYVIGAYEDESVTIKP